MGRTVYVVARDHPELYAYLCERFASDGAVEVILDRRVSQRRQVDIPHAPERRQNDRRTHPESDMELETRSHAIITLPDTPR
jgi:hypothetical protein